MPLEIDKIVDEKELEGEELLQDLVERVKKCEINAIQDKRLIFARVLTSLKKIFGSFYTSEKSDPMVLIARVLSHLRQNPHLKGRKEKIVQVSKLMMYLADSGLLKLKRGRSEEPDYTIIRQRLLIEIIGGEEKVYEIVRKIPSARKAAEEEKERLDTCREELKLIEQIRLTCKQLDSLIRQLMNDKIKLQAAQTVQKYFKDIEQKIKYAHCILTGTGYVDDEFVAQLKLESLDLADQMKERTTIQKMIFLESLNWYRHHLANSSFNNPDIQVYFLISHMIFRHAPWNPKGNAEIREAFENIGVSCTDLERTFNSHHSAGQQGERDVSSIKVNHKREHIDLLITQLVALSNMIGRRKSVKEGIILINTRLLPGLRSPTCLGNIKIIFQEIKSLVKMDCLGKLLRLLSMDTQLGNCVDFLRKAFGDNSFIQQLLSLRVAHGLSNLHDNKDREIIAAFISPMDVVRFLTAMVNGSLTVTEATTDKVTFSVRGRTGKLLNTSTRTLTSKGLTYDEAAGYINKEFENMLLNYERPDFEAHCTDCNPGYSREKDVHVKIKQYSWVCERYPFLKFYFGAASLLVSPIMFNILEGERQKKEKTIHQSTADFMDKVIELERYLVEKIEEVTKSLDVSVLDKNRMDSHIVSGEGKTVVSDGKAVSKYWLLLEEGVREVFPKLNFELLVMIKQADESFSSDEVYSDFSGLPLTDEMRAFEEKYKNFLIDAEAEGDAPANGSMVCKRSVEKLFEALQNISIVFKALKKEGYQKRITVMRRDQIVANIRDARYYIRDILKTPDHETQDASRLLHDSDDLLEKIRDSIQLTEVIEETVNVEAENVEMPLYEIHSILVTINSSYMVTLSGLIELMGRKHKTARGKLIKGDQKEAVREIWGNINSALNTLIRNARSIKFENPSIPVGLRDAMTVNITSAIGEINRLKRSRLIMQRCQHPNDLSIFLNVIAREMLERKLIMPFNNIKLTLKKCPIYMDDQQYPIWNPEGVEKMTTSIFGQMDIPVFSLDDLPSALHSVINISDQMADQLVVRGHKQRLTVARQSQPSPEKTNFDILADRMTRKVSGVVGQLHAYFVPDEENNITFDPENLENILRVIGICIGELIALFKDFNKNKDSFVNEINKLRKIAPVLEGLRNCVNDYNAKCLKQKKTADLARSQTNCDKTLIAFCQELSKYEDSTTSEYKILIIRGRVYISLENLAQKVLGVMKGDFNAERKKKYQILLNEIFYMMSHVKTEKRDFPLFKKFRQSALRAAAECGKTELAKEVKALLENGEEVKDWIKLADSDFEEEVINACYQPGVDLDRLRRLGENI